MKKFIYKILFSIFFIPAGLSSDAQKKIADFRLKSTGNKWVSLKKYPNAKGFIIVFICNHCPFANRYTERINALNKKYKPLGIPLLAVNSSDTLIFSDETFSKMAAAAKKRDIPFLTCMIIPSR